MKGTVMDHDVRERTIRNAVRDRDALEAELERVKDRLNQVNRKLNRLWSGKASDPTK